MPVKQGANDSEIFTSDDLLVNPDDLLPPVVKLEKYANSEIVFNRQVVARNLLETLRLVQGNKDEVERVVHVFNSISEDFNPSVRSELMVQLPHIAAFCNEAKLNNIIEDHLVPMLINYLGDENNQVRKSYYSTLISVIDQGLLDFEIVRDKICPSILSLTDSIHSEEIRTESIVLMSKLIVLLGKKVAEELFFEHFFALCADKSNYIRKACASTFGDICTTVGREVTEEVLLSKFFVLCEDLAWAVRKACAENFMAVSCVVSRDTRSRYLSSVYLALLFDQSRWVRMTAYQALGPFISTFAEPEKTGLYYSKDGVLTIIDPLPTPSSEEGQEHVKTDALCNGDIDISGDDDGDISRLCDQTSSSRLCDSVVPPTAASHADVPYISCHVGSRSVIETNSSSVSRLDDHLDCASTTAENDDSCDLNDKSGDVSTGDKVTLVSNREGDRADVIGCSILEGEDYDQNFPSLGPEKSSRLVNGEIGVNCEAWNNVCARKILTKKSLVLSMDSDCCSPEDSASIEEPQDSADANFSVQTPVIDNDSAFNHFQYWREPLPEVDVLDVIQVSSDWTPLKGCHRISRGRGKSLLYSKGEPPPDNDELQPIQPSLSPHDQDVVPPELLLQYLSMINAAWAQTIDAEIARHCAYSLPAVALTLGRQYWPCLRETFNALSSDLQGFIMMWKVRRTVASSMHQLALILGPEITTKDLMPVWARFIRDLDEVRIGILQHLYEFLKVIGPDERMKFLPRLPEFLVSNSENEINEKNWRFRLILAEQLVLIADLFTPLQVREYMIPLSFLLLKDKISEVRLAAVRVLSAVVKRLSQNPTPVHSKAVLGTLIKELVLTQRYRRRQLYVYLSQQIIQDQSLSLDQYAEDVLPQLLVLANDGNTLVRITVSRCLALVLWPLEAFSSLESCHRERVLQSLHKLQTDTDPDVRFYARTACTKDCPCHMNGEFDNISESEPYV